MRRADSLFYIVSFTTVSFAIYILKEILTEMTGGKIGEYIQRTFGISTTFLVVILFIISGVVLAFEIYQRWKENNEKLNTYTWEDITKGTTRLWREVGKDFDAECLLMLSIEGTIIASYALTQASKLMPTYFAMIEDKNGAKLISPPQDHVTVSTKKWNTYLPKSLFKEKDKKLLIIDSQVITGSTKNAIYDLLEKKGFQRNNIFFASFVCSDLAIRSNGGADYFVHKITGSEVKFPWGQWITEKNRRG